MYQIDHLKFLHVKIMCIFSREQKILTSLEIFMVKL